MACPRQELAISTRAYEKERAMTKKGFFGEGTYAYGPFGMGPSSWTDSHLKKSAFCMCDHVEKFPLGRALKNAACASFFALLTCALSWEEVQWHLSLPMAKWAFLALKDK